jgi:glycosyltransferase 2 family protein
VEAGGLSRDGSGRRRSLLPALQALVSLVALGAVVWWATRQEAPELPRTREALAWLAGALVLYALTTLARAERWHRVVSRALVPVTRGDTYRLTVVGYMGNNVLPARGGDVLRAFLLAPITRVRKRDVLGTVVAERLLDAIALALVFAAAVFVFVRDARVPAAKAILVGGLGVAALLALALATLLLIRRASRRDDATAPVRAARRVREVVRPLAAPTRQLASGAGVGLLALSLVVWTLEASVYLAVARAGGLELTLLEALYVVALTNLFALVPAAPGYVGTFDAAVLFAVGSLEATGAESLAYLVLLRFLLFVPITLVGLGFLLARYGGWARLRLARLD